MPTLRERKREQSRAATIRAAWELFVDRGYDHVTVQDICDAAEIAPRTFHRYFANKEDVLAEPVRRMMAVLTDEVEAGPAGAPDAAVLRAALLAVGRFVINNRDFLEALRVVVAGAQHLRGAHLGVRPDKEAELAAQLAGRHPGGTPPDWRLRLLVATSLAAFRVWYDDYFRDAPTDPVAHLGEILAAAGLEN
jgi:AcrR family transcriptional regulator